MIMNLSWSRSLHFQIPQNFTNILTVSHATVQFHLRSGLDLNMLYITNCDKASLFNHYSHSTLLQAILPYQSSLKFQSLYFTWIMSQLMCWMCFPHLIR